MGVATVGSPVRRGGSFPINQPRDEFSGDRGNDQGTRTIRVLYTPGSTSWTAHLPAQGAAHPGASWLVFSSYSLRQVGRGMADLVLSYTQDPDTAINEGEDVPEDEVTEDASTERIDITRHPEFNVAKTGYSSKAMADFYDWGAGRIYHEATLPDEWVDASGQTVACPNAGTTVPERIRGMDSYLVGTGTVTVVEWSRNEPTNVIPDAGKRGVPTGYAGTDDYWLILSGTRRRNGAFWQRVITYQYSGKPIDTIVYPAAT